ncbi:hypothetical protein COU49_02030 [Candidatus Nomurabacteria bacterium CG10_big_fil_rev_8_21_14_0_10_35_16]|uniref:Serine hydrolase family protein n=1 Tax=Candidatus Nomurabacteria bacterium CG10_big_fil_rev_8_21_14_0_10_35_16 TaxID=1974731 RepID=A0A2H0TB31_9BACT|nr:MAG: hypothetical protein COU49_02030 [Candidatus Nomurabacteria bacterium CG10_big_fil_rev_8_21_14_0_10_35_16]
MKDKTNCIIIHGCPPNEAEYDVRKIKGHFHWIPWVAEKINQMGIKTINPLMPSPWAPDYEAYKKEFEKNSVDENTILIGHSCGCAFLVNWLGDTKQKIKKLILIAPWKVNSRNDVIREKFYSFQIDSTISERVGEIVMFTSDTERDGGIESLKIYHETLGGKIISLANHGHYTFPDMGTREFPELLEEIPR